MFRMAEKGFRPNPKGAPVTDETQSLSIEANLSELARVFTWFSAAYEAQVNRDQILHNVRLCLEEMLGNVILHGQPSDGKIMISLIRLENGQGFDITICDRGAEFDPTRHAQTLTASNLRDVEIGGLGIALVKRFANRLTYERRDGFNVLTLGFDPQNPRQG